MNTARCKVVFLDAGSLLQALRFDAAYEAHDTTPADRVAERIVQADVVSTNETMRTH